MADMALPDVRKQFLSQRFRFFLTIFGQLLRACILRDRGRMSVPKADIALSDVIEQIWTIRHFSIFLPF